MDSHQEHCRQNAGNMYTMHCKDFFLCVVKFFWTVQFFQVISIQMYCKISSVNSMEFIIG